MSPRLVLTAGLIALAGLASAVAPWTIASGGLTETVAAQVRALSGLELNVAGRSTLALLPVPRIKFETVALNDSTGAALVRSRQFRAEFRILPLFIGRFELGDLTLSGAEILVETSGEGRSAWAGVGAKLRDHVDDRSGAGPHVRRLIVTGSRLIARDQGESQTEIRQINVVANWPAKQAALDLGGSVEWRGETVGLRLTELRPSELLAGRTSPFDAKATWAGGLLAAQGEATLGEEPRAMGVATFETGSLRDLLHWTDSGLPFGSLIGPMRSDGKFQADRAGLAMPDIRLRIGIDRLDGALSARLSGERVAVTATLATDRIDLTDLLGPFGQITMQSGPWSDEPLDISGPAGGDLDLRLSATNARIGALQLEDLAANVLIKPGRIEASLGRATLNRGVVKGRLGMVAGASGVDLKMTGAFDGLDLGGLVGDLGHNRWITGLAHGQVALEGVGASAADLVRQLGGRATIAVRQGELVGISLGEVLRRADRRPLSAPLEWRGGRTSFDQAQVTLGIAQGLCEITESGLSSASLRGDMQGRVSLIDRTLALRAKVESVLAQPGPASSILLDINGPWSDVGVAPDARALIQRSGAAQPLLPPDLRARVGAEGPTSSVRAQ